VGNVVVALVQLRRLGAAQTLVELARRDRDPAHDVALLQLIDDQLFAAVLAVQRIIDALGLESGRQLLERDAEIARDIGQRLVQDLIADRDADALGALQLHLLQDQLIQHLLLDDRQRRQLHPLARRLLRLLLPQPCDDDLEAFAQLAFQHDAFVDDRRDAIEQLAARAQLARLCGGLVPGQQRRAGRQGGRNA
jgi:hypothetical protein